MIKYFFSVFYYFLYKFRNIRDYSFYYILDFKRIFVNSQNWKIMRLLSDKIGYIKLWNKK